MISYQVLPDIYFVFLVDFLAIPSDTAGSSATSAAGSSAAATLAEQGFQVKLITYHDSPRRAHSVAAQGGINAAKHMKEDDLDGINQLI